MPNVKMLIPFVVTLAVLILAAPTKVRSEAPIEVVATFSILGDMVKRIGGEHVNVATLVGADGDTHVYQPTPAAARTLSKAQLLVVNGLQYEGWIDRLIDASDFKGVRVVATENIEPIVYDGEHSEHDEHDDHDKHSADEEHADNKEHADEAHADDKEHADEEHAKHEEGDEHEASDAHHHDHGAFDPHAWHSLSDAVHYVDNITAALAQLNPDQANTFNQNRAEYVAEIKSLDAEIRDLLGAIPENRRTIVTSHDAFQYFARDYGLTFVAPQGVSTDSEATAQDIAGLIKLIREKEITAVFLEKITDPRLLKRIADETGASIGGTLYTGALSQPDGPASTYIAFIRHNAQTLAHALSE